MKSKSEFREAVLLLTTVMIQKRCRCVSRPLTASMARNNNTATAAKNGAAKTESMRFTYTSDVLRLVTHSGETACDTPPEAAKYVLKNVCRKPGHRKANPLTKET